MRTPFALTLLCCLGLAGATDVPVPASCTPTVNSALANLIRKHPRKPVDNVMVCGVTTGPSTTQPGGPHGDHQVLSLMAPMPTGSPKLVQVVTNDALDGKVTAGAKAQVFAFGQAYFDAKKFAAGVHDVHCSTHSGADNGWVVVDGKKYPAAACQ